MKTILLFLLTLALPFAAFTQDYPSKFASLDGWTVEGEKQFFSPENLYDYINGAADFYLGYAFQDLWVVDYKNGEEQRLTIELYRHGDAMQAFGIYTEERPQTAHLLDIGAQGFLENGAILFLAGDYYVKVFNSTPEVSEASFIAFSQSVAKAICTSCGLPRQFTWFPPKGRIASSERYMSENFMGITGFDGVCTVEYATDTKPIRLFVFKGDDAQCKDLLSAYFKRVNYKKRIKEITYILNDPYLGKVSMAYKNGVITGVIGAVDPQNYVALLDALSGAVE